MTCQCVAKHSPRLTSTAGVIHHILPKSWHGPDTPDNKIEICPTAHDLVHELLNLYVHAGGKPPWHVLKLYPKLVRELAAKAWEQRPSDKPPYTMVRGEA